MRNRYKIIERKAPHFITCTVVGWVPVFTRQKYLDIITSSLAYCRQQKGLHLHAYVILDNHLHLVVSSDDLSEVIRDFKRHTAKEIVTAAQLDNKSLLLGQFAFLKERYKTESTYQIWQEGVHPQAITTEDMLRQKMDYIHYNPVKRGLVDRPEHWRYSSARNYLGLVGVLDVDVVES